MLFYAAGRGWHATDIADHISDQVVFGRSLARGLLILMHTVTLTIQEGRLSLWLVVIQGIAAHPGCKVKIGRKLSTDTKHLQETHESQASPARVRKLTCDQEKRTLTLERHLTRTSACMTTGRRIRRFRP